MPLTATPVPARREKGRFDLFAAVEAALYEAGLRASDGDVLVLSSKYAAVSQGRVLDLAGVRVSRAGAALARKHGMSPRLAEVVLRESDHILGGMAGFVMAAVGGMVAPNAGIDRSNSGGAGAVVLYPAEPDRLAERVRRKALVRWGARIGVIISDSRIMPARAGTVGVAVACAGIEPVDDMRAFADLDGRPLKVTRRATADGLATAANHVMGEGAESVPVCLVGGAGGALAGRGATAAEAAIPHDQCVYSRALGGPRGRGRPRAGAAPAGLL